MFVSRFPLRSWPALWSVWQQSVLGQSDHILFFFSPCRWEAFRVQAVSPALEGLLGHDQTSAYPQRRLTLPVHHLPGVLPQLVHHAEAHEGPQARGHPTRLEDREDLSVPVLRLIETEPPVGMGWDWDWDWDRDRDRGWGSMRMECTEEAKRGECLHFWRQGWARQGWMRGRGEKNVLKYGGVVTLLYCVLLCRDGVVTQTGSLLYSLRILLLYQAGIFEITPF